MSLQDISQSRFTDGKLNLRRFHQARWDEPVIFELSCPGQRGLLLPEVETELRAAVGDGLDTLPAKMRRQEPPRLPELSQPQVLRHYVQAWHNVHCYQKPRSLRQPSATG